MVRSRPARALVHLRRVKVAIRVLIVDDAASVRRELRTVLGLAGEIEVAGLAEDGAQAVEMSAQLEPDVVLMDLEMPVMDGCEAARRIKAARPSTRIVALTIHDDPKSREQAAQAGTDDFIVKDVSTRELLRAVRGSS
jgi:DNA-binding NarL/FixJ family response regulator